MLDRYDQRIFTPASRGSLSRKRGYRRRRALERIGARSDRSFGFEPRFLRGMSRMRTRAGLAPTVMMGLASGRVRAGRARNGCPRCTARFPPRSRGGRLRADTG